jgi:hypothetical protein
MRLTRFTLTGTRWLSSAHFSALLALTLALPIAVRAQTGAASTGSPPTAAGKASSRPAGAVSGHSVFDGITLTPRQRATIEASAKTTHAARAAIFARLTPGTPLSESDRLELDRLAESHTAVLRSTLTPAQRTTLDSNVALHQAERSRERSRQSVKATPILNVPKAGAQ